MKKSEKQKEENRKTEASNKSGNPEKKVKPSNFAYTGTGQHIKSRYQRPDGPGGSYSGF